MTTTAPSPREVEALAVVEETERLLVEVRRLLESLPVVEVQESTVEAAESPVERRTQPG